MAHSAEKQLHNNDLGPGPSDRAIMWAVAAGVCVIAAVTFAAMVAAPDFGPGVHLEPAAYALIGLCVSALYVTFVASFMSNAFRAGVWLILYWAFTMLAMCVIFQVAR